jgi:hypothetical protein
MESFDEAHQLYQTAYDNGEMADIQTTADESVSFRPDPDLLPTDVAAEDHSVEANTSGNGEVITDPALVELLTTNADALGADRLDRILAAGARYNHTHTDYDDKNNEIIDEHFGNKKLLVSLPGYAEASEAAGVPSEDSDDLLVIALESEVMPGMMYGDMVVDSVAGVFAASTPETPLNANDIASLKSLAIESGSRHALVNTMRTVSAARRAGLPATDSIAVAQGVLDGNAGSLDIRADAWRLHSLFETLEVADADPALVSGAVGAIQELRYPHDRKEIYDSLKQAIADGPGAGQTANELLGDISRRVQGGTGIADAIRESSRQAAQALEAGATVQAPGEQRERYFVEKSGTLVPARLPYRTVRSLNEGVADIQKITGRSPDNGEKVEKGAWVFDPASGTWYSLGGETKQIGINRYRHTHPDYDVSDLSASPQVFYIHPTVSAPKRVDKVDYLLPNLVDLANITKLHETAGGPVDLGVFISHSRGITEFTHPNDPQALRDFTDTYKQNMNDVYYAIFRGWQYVPMVVHTLGKQVVLDRFFETANDIMDDRFSFTLHPPGADIEAIVRARRAPGGQLDA